MSAFANGGALPPAGPRPSSTAVDAVAPYDVALPRWDGADERVRDYVTTSRRRHRGRDDPRDGAQAEPAPCAGTGTCCTHRGRMDALAPRRPKRVPGIPGYSHGALRAKRLPRTVQRVE